MLSFLMENAMMNLEDLLRDSQEPMMDGMMCVLHVGYVLEEMYSNKNVSFMDGINIAQGSKSQKQTW